MNKHIFPVFLITTIFTSPAICAITDVSLPQQCITVDVCGTNQTKVCAQVSGCANVVCKCLDNTFQISCTTDADCGIQTVSCDENGICTLSSNTCLNTTCHYDTKYLYACGNGFYGTCTNNQDSSTCNCQQCPDGGTSPTPLIPSKIAAYKGSESLQDCYLPAGTYTDNVGNFTISAPCNHD